METIAHGQHWGRLAAAALYERVRLLLSEGRHTAASAAVDRLDALAAEYDAPNRCAWSAIRIFAGAARARLEVAEERPRNAVERLKSLRAEFDAAQNSYGLLRLEIVLAIALIAANARAEASTLLRSTALAAARAGIRQIFLEAGAAPLAPILKTLNLGPDHSGWCQSIAAHWQAQDRRAAKSAQSAKEVAFAGLRDPLSARERSVLELIGQGQSNKEIARTLDIAPETAKSHIKNIFMKLAVNTRAQAVSRAQALGLVRTQWLLPSDWLDRAVGTAADDVN
jgi:LuxR family maltose regulon positive regulatory protein